MTSRDEIAARLADLEDGKPIGLVWPLGGFAERDLKWLLAHADALAGALDVIIEDFYDYLGHTGAGRDALIGARKALAAYRGEQA